MHPLLIYLLKANALLLFLGIFYKIFLKKETFYTFNRWYFLLGIPAACIAPLITFTKTVIIEQQPVIYTVNDTVPNTVSGKITIPEPAFLDTFDWQNTFAYAVVCISLGMLVIMLVKVILLYVRLKKLPEVPQTNIKISENNTVVYSFYRWIVVPKNIFSWSDHEMMIDHENIHLNQKHTIDLILIELVSAVFWFNPLIKSVQKDININLEFLVDEKMVQKHEAVVYQKSLLLVQNKDHLMFTNAFNSSDLKKRILQLNTKKSNHMRKFKILITAPALLAFFTFFQIKTVAQVRTMEVREVSSHDDVLADSFYIQIHNSYDDVYFKRMQKMLQEKYDLNVLIKDLKRNNDGLLTAINIVCTDQDFVNKHLADKPLEPFTLHIFKKGTGYSIESVNTDASQGSFQIEAAASSKKEGNPLTFDAKTLRSNRKMFDQVARKFPVIVDGIRLTKKQLKKFDNTTITEMDLEYDPAKTSKPVIVNLSTKKSFLQMQKQSEGTYKTLFVQNSSDTNNGDFISISKTAPSITVYKDADINEIMANNDSNKPYTIFEVKSGKENMDADYVIDGKEVSSDDFGKIDPNTIKNINIIKNEKTINKEKSIKNRIEITTHKNNKHTFLKETAQVRQDQIKIVLDRKKALADRRKALEDRKRALENRKETLEKLKETRAKEFANF